MFFESKHSVSKQEFQLSFGSSIVFPLHLHRSFEFFAQISGTSEVVVGDKTYLLHSGDAVLIFPFQLHSYRGIGEGKRAICIFSPELVPDFYQEIAHRVPRDSRFSHTISQDIRTDNIFLRRAAAYGICGAFAPGRVYEDIRETNDMDLLTKLLLFAERNFRSECLLRDTAVTVGYDYAYVSKFFKRKVGLSFRRYVTLLRINESKQLLTESEKSISVICEACGFQSLRTFDREFQAVVGKTPSEYRKQKSSAPREIP